jgi:hypothetical protein
LTLAGGIILKEIREKAKMDKPLLAGINNFSSSVMLITPARSFKTDFYRI